MPFVVGERAGSKRYMDLQDIGRVISQRVSEQRPNTQYLRAASVCTVVIVLGPLVHRLQPELQQIWVIGSKQIDCILDCIASSDCRSSRHHHGAAGTGGAECAAAGVLVQPISSHIA